MSHKTQVNIVEMMADEEQAFDQACSFENRVGSHGTYCHNAKVGARKCPYRWTSAKWHSECEGYESNPGYKNQWETENKPEEEQPPSEKPFRYVGSIGWEEE